MAERRQPELKPQVLALIGTGLLVLGLLLLSTGEPRVGRGTLLAAAGLATVVVAVARARREQG